jgi:GxxExxY protein
MDGLHKDITERVLGCALDVHSRLGPGLLESTYRACMAHRLAREGLSVESEVPIPIRFDGMLIETAYRADLIVERKVLLELKAVETVSSIHLAQLRTYMEHSHVPIGLLLNFNVRSLKEGIRRLVLDRSIGPDGCACPTHSPQLPPTRSSRLE